jgi:hypothetical protein
MERSGDSEFSDHVSLGIGIVAALLFYSPPVSHHRISGLFEGDRGDGPVTHCVTVGVSDPVPYIRHRLITTENLYHYTVEAFGQLAEGAILESFVVHVDRECELHGRLREVSNHDG